MHILHPFMPFITEEIWQYLKERKEGESIMISKAPAIGPSDIVLNERFELVKQLITNIRGVRNERGIPVKESLVLKYTSVGDAVHSGFEALIKKLANLASVENLSEKSPNALSFVVKNTEYVIPLDGKMDIEEEKAKLIKELEYSRGFLNSVLKKLDNQRFVENAPPGVLQKELDKKSDAESKIAAIEKQLQQLG